MILNVCKMISSIISMNKIKLLKDKTVTNSYRVLVKKLKKNVTNNFRYNDSE